CRGRRNVPDRHTPRRCAAAFARPGVGPCGDWRRELYGRDRWLSLQKGHERLSDTVLFYPSSPERVIGVWRCLGRSLILISGSACPRPDVPPPTYPPARPPCVVLASCS